MKRFDSLRGGITRQWVRWSGSIEWTDRRGRTLRLPLMRIIIPVVLLIFLVGVLDIFHLRPHYIAPEKVWKQAQREGERSGLEPRFIYAICWAESSLNAHARSGYARGMMQLSRDAWKEVGGGGYRKAFRWKRNMRIGVDYLLFCRERLLADGAFNYTNLAAAYRYGPYRLASEGYDLRELPEPRNRIYQALLSGNSMPLAPPDSSPESTKMRVN